MKFKLMIQSLSPLALLTIISNFDFIIKNNDGKTLSTKEFLCENLVLLTVLCFCILWVVLSIWFYIEFKAFQSTDKKAGYDITIKTEKSEDSLNFFLTLILPLLIDNIDKWQGAVVFFLILLMICILLYKTKLFYANPILSILGYRIYEFDFCKNKEVSKNNLIGICHGNISSTITYKEITDTVFYIKGDK